MTKAEFIAYLEGYFAAKRDQEYPDPEMFDDIIAKAKELDEESPAWYSEVDKLIGEYVSKLPGPNDWSVDTSAWPDWVVKTR